METENIEIIDPQTVTQSWELKHDSVLEKLVEEAKLDHEILGYMVIGSVATKTHHKESDIDVISIVRKGKPSSGINNLKKDGITVDSLFFTYNVFKRSVETVPYLLHTIVDSRLLFDPEKKIEPLIEEVKKYFEAHPQIVNEWKRYYEQSKSVKERIGCRAGESGANTIIDVWNEFETKYSGGKIRRPFFNAFYLTNPRIFSLVKRYLLK